MHYLSIDIETLGLNPDTCDVIEIAAIYDNGLPLDKLPTFHCFVDQPVYSGEIYAMAMHSALFQEMKAQPKELMVRHDNVCFNLAWFINQFETDEVGKGLKRIGWHRERMVGNINLRLFASKMITVWRGGSSNVLSRVFDILGAIRSAAARMKTRRRPS